MSSQCLQLLRLVPRDCAMRSIVLSFGLMDDLCISWRITTSTRKGLRRWSERHSCSQQRTDSALYPTIRHFERAAGFTLDDTTQTKLDKLDALLAQSSTSAHDAALFADMLSLPNDGRYPALELSPQQRRERTLDALVSQVAALS